MMGASPSPPSGWREPAILAPRLKWMTGIRLFLGALFLGSASLLLSRRQLPFPDAPLFALTGLIFGLSVLYALLLRRGRNLPTLCYGQFALDMLLETGLVHYTGGLDSPLSFVYVFSIFAAAVIFPRRGSLLMAAASSILYGLLMDLEFYGILPSVAVLPGSPSGRPFSFAVYQVFITIVGFFLVAILSSHLAERLREAGRRLEEQSLDLRNLRTLHRDIIANIPSGILTLDLQGRIISLNAAASRITGMPAAGLQDRHWNETLFRDCVGFPAFFRDPQAASTMQLELDVKTPDGRAIPLGLTLSPLREDGGATLGLVVIFQDLTERKRIEERFRQADRLAAVGQMAAGIAHEIRNPLAAISGSIQVLQGELAPTGSSRQLLEIVLREAERLKLITGQFLDFARPGGATVRRCRLRPLTEETLLLLTQSRGPDPAVRVSVEAEEDDLEALADADQLKQVFWNICLNALEAMPQGGDLTIRLRALDGRRPGGPWVAVEFADSGGGIRAEDFDRIFDPFYTTKRDGVGLGLSIARKAVEGMGGAVEVENRVGQGATFRLVLPRAGHGPASRGGTRGGRAAPRTAPKSAPRSAPEAA